MGTDKTNTDKTARLIEDSRSEQKLSLTEEEAGLIVQQLPRYTVADPSPADTQALLHKLLPLMNSTKADKAGEGQRFADLLEDAEARAAPTWQERCLRWIQPHQHLFSLWHCILVAMVILCIGLAGPLFPTSSQQSQVATMNWLPFFLPLFAGVTLSFSLRSIGTPMMELERSLPVSPALWMMSRLTLIVLFYSVVALASSTLFILWQAPFSLLALVISWLIPMLLYCAGSLSMMLRFGPVTGSVFMAFLWVAQPLFRHELGVFYFVGDPSWEGWLLTKGIALLLALLLATDIVRLMRKLNLRHQRVTDLGGSR